MKPLNFIKSLLPSFSKQMMLDDIRTTRMTLSAVVIPSYHKSMSLFGSRKMANPILKEQSEQFRQQVRGANGANLIVSVEKAFVNILGTLDVIEALVEKDYTDTVESVGITYRKAAVLQMLESITFVSDYAMRYLNYAIVVETVEIGKDNADTGVQVDEVTTTFTPADLRFINDRFHDFCVSMQSFIKAPAALQADIAEVPDVVIDEKTDMVMSRTQALGSMDKFGHGLIPLPMNPIYFIRMRVANYQHHKYEKAKAEKEALELRMLRLQKVLKGGSADPTLEKQIELLQQRIDEQDQFIKKEEAQYA